MFERRGRSRSNIARRGTWLALERHESSAIPLLGTWLIRHLLRDTVRMSLATLELRVSLATEDGAKARKDTMSQKTEIVARTKAAEGAREVLADLLDEHIDSMTDLKPERAADYLLTAMWIAGYKMVRLDDEDIKRSVADGEEGMDRGGPREDGEEGDRRQPAGGARGKGKRDDPD